MGILACCGLLSASAHGQSIVRMETNLGNIDVELFDEATPVTVANFLNYVDSGKYINALINRSVPGFIVQGGGFRITSGLVAPVTADPPIVNEFDPSRSNLRGTIAMAKLPGDPNSASKEWFFNLADNSANLDNQNGGFTVFGQAISNGMDVVDAIAALGIVDCVSPFDELPLTEPVTCPNIIPSQHMVIINRITRLVTLTPISPATVTNASAIDNPSPTNAPDGVTFQQGFFSFQINGLTPGGSTMVAMQLPPGYVPNTYYMYGPTSDNNNPHWYEFKFDGRTGAEFFGSNFVVLNFVDGERGDSDLLANGLITDPGAPGVTAATTPTSSSSSGGGCTLATNPDHSSIPVEYWLLTLAFVVRLGYRAKMGTTGIIATAPHRKA